MQNRTTPSCSAPNRLGREAAEFAPATDWSEMGASEHFVQFYETSDFLIESVAKFVAAGLRAGDGAVVIATRAHREALERRLVDMDVDPIAARTRGQFVPLDAAKTLALFMVDGRPDRDRFFAALEPIILRLTNGGRRLRAFGEMVALLWADGKGDAAIALEERWNELATVHQFALFCAYPLQGFCGEANGQSLAHICKTHTRVIPAESYAAEPDRDERLRAILRLQQKAESLEKEVADRKRAESELREQQTKVTMAVAIAQLGVWELDMITQAFSCSEQCKAHFGFAPEAEVTFADFIGRVDASDRPHMETALRSALVASADYSAEFRIADAAGAPRWIACLGRCFHNGSHRMLGVTLDISGRKQAAELLERTVAQRTAELQATYGELEAFSYSISHDMRAPLRSMRGFADILLKDWGDKLEPECQGYLQRIATAGERMDRLIQDVLTFSRVARGDVKLEPVNLDHLVRGIIECYPNLQPPHATVAIEGRLQPVLGNAAALTQCVSNLLGNAVKFVAPGVEPRVRIWMERGKAGVTGATVRLYVQDNGIGIPREGHEKIFAIFQRLSRDYEGTGIGLAIVKKAVERMGGSVGVGSEPGEGSTFWLELKTAAVL